MPDSLSELFTKGLKAILDIFPDSPFLFMQELAADPEISALLGFVNWFVPFNVFVGIFEGWLVCVAVYYVWQIVLRWIKVVE